MDLNSHTNLESRAITYYWDKINSLSAKTSILYDYTIDNKGYDIDAQIVKKELLPFGGSYDVGKIAQEVKVRKFPSTDWKAQGGLILEKMKVDKMNEGDLYTTFLTDCSYTFRVTKELISKCKLIKKKMNHRTASDLQNSGEKIYKEVYLLPLIFGIKKSYN